MKVLVIEDDEDIIDTITLAFQVGWPGTELVSTYDTRFLHCPHYYSHRND